MHACRWLSLPVPITRVLLISLAVVLVTGAKAQDDDQQLRTRSSIIDDSTKQVYGPTTSRIIREQDIFYNQWISHPIDTVIRNFHRFNFTNRNDNFYQDLGNIGTAIRPVYDPVPDVIGTTSGFTAYDLYWNAYAVKYYNTRSPYTNLNLVLGGRGRSVTNVDFSRNINPRWNFGFHYRGLLIDKQIQRQGKGDRNVRSTYYDLFTSYTNKDSTYSIFASFRRMNHRVFEFGGVKVEDTFTFPELFLENAQPWLTSAETKSLRRSYHVFHQYSVGNALQLYHQLDSDRQQNEFLDNYPGEPNKDFFDTVIEPRSPFAPYPSDSTKDKTHFNTLRNEVGIKGNLLKLFYNGYVALRSFDMVYKFVPQEDFTLNTKGNEFYIGGRMALQLDSLILVRGQMESMLDDRYSIQGSIETKWFTASIKRAVYTPTFLQLAYRGRHDEWLNNFNSVEASELRGSLIYRSPRFSIVPGLRLATFRNFIFFKQDEFEGTDQTVLPVQSGGLQTLGSPELYLSITPLKHTTLSAHGIYTRLLENADNAMQLPELFVNAQLAYANIWVHGNFDFQIGLDAHWRSAYYAYAYDPAIAQYYTQQNNLVPAYPQIDVFFNARILKGRIFVKYTNLFKAFNTAGYIPTPFYPGVINTIDFGFDWSFYD
jgi:hypothetical protein